MVKIQETMLMVKVCTSKESIGNLCVLDNSYQSILEYKDADISAVVYVVPPHDGIRVVLHPDPSQGIPTDLIVFVRPLYNQN